MRTGIEVQQQDALWKQISALSEARHKLHLWQLLHAPGRSEEYALENPRRWSTSTCLPMVAYWISLQQEMTDAYISCSSAWFLVNSGEPWFHRVWWSDAESCHFLRDNEPSGGNKCLSACAYAHPSVLRYRPGTYFMELKVIMHHRINRPNPDIQLFCNFVDRPSSVLKHQFPCSFLIQYGCGCGWTTRALCTRLCRPF
jgi:hypothetical protein